MIKQYNRNKGRQRRHLRIRRKINGTSIVPRLSVFRSNKNIFAQIINDIDGKTLIQVSSLKLNNGGNVAGAKTVGQLVAEKALKVGISQVVFDRGGYLYHGRVKALADAARESGLKI